MQIRKRVAWRVVSSSLIASALVVPAARGAAAAACPPTVVFDVLNNADSGTGSLRQAILDANANPNPPAGCTADAIEFNIPGAGPRLITLASDLPKIKDPVNVRGYTQPGSVAATATTPATINVWIDASNAKNGLVVKTDDSSISGLVIGGAGSAVTSLAADDGDGIKVIGDGNRIRGNDIGTHQQITAPPTFLQGTVGDGIDVTGNGNQVGSNTAEDRDVIAASGLLAGTSDAYGVKIAGNDNTVQGDTIGTDPGVTTDQIGNRGGGVDIVSGTGNKIGGSAGGAGDLISANGGPAILIQGAASGTLVLGTTIGTDGADSPDYGNGRGVVIEQGSTKNAIGSTADGGGNLIANTESGPGIDVAGNENLLLHNTVGTNTGQTTALPNLGGIGVTGNLNIIGGDAANAGNVVSGNTFYGISLADGSDPTKAVGNVIWGNHIGTDATGTVAIGNAGDGIQILGGDATQIGGSGGAGFRPNVIANNGGAGVGVGTGIHNAIVQNRIHDNGGLGIDLSRDGAVLANDAGDGDAGPNGLQNHPLITGATTVLGVTSVAWDATSFLSDPSETTEIDFYQNDACDPSGNGEGQTLVGSTVLGTGALPAASSTAMSRRVPSGTYITAIATSGVGVPRAPGRTSEFSPCFLVP